MTDLFETMDRLIEGTLFVFIGVLIAMPCLGLAVSFLMNAHEAFQDAKRRRASKLLPLAHLSFLTAAVLPIYAYAGLQEPTVDAAVLRLQIAGGVALGGLILFALAKRPEPTAETIPEKKEEPEAPPRPPKNAQDAIAEIQENPEIPEHWKRPFIDLIERRGYVHARDVRAVPHFGGLCQELQLARYRPTGTSTLGDLIQQQPWTHPLPLFRETLETYWDDLSALPCSFSFPEKIRTQHHHIVAMTGHGKTELIKHLVMRDVEQGRGVIVIDSQNKLINELATRIPLDRLILVDPVHCPPPLNLFRVDASSELFEYIFQALDAEMTAKQSTAYQFVSQMVVAAGGNIRLMQRILEPGEEWRQHVGRLGETAQSFFEHEYASKQFAETRQQINRRLYQVLKNEDLERMLFADECLDIAKAIAERKVVLVSTAKHRLKKRGAALFGRIFVAQIMQAVIGREDGSRAFLYLDEFQDYVEDSDIFFDLFEQARKYEFGLIVAHQYLDQLSPQIAKSLAANTAIKFAGGVSAEDARKLAEQMDTASEFIRAQPVGTFAASFKGIGGGISYRVELDRSPVMQDISAVRENMRQRFAPLPHHEGSPNEPYSRPSGEWGSGGEVPERGEW